MSKGENCFLALPIPYTVNKESLAKLHSDEFGGIKFAPKHQQMLGKIRLWMNKVWRNRRT